MPRGRSGSSASIHGEEEEGNDTWSPQKPHAGDADPGSPDGTANPLARSSRPSLLQHLLKVPRLTSSNNHSEEALRLSHGAPGHRMLARRQGRPQQADPQHLGPDPAQIHIRPLAHPCQATCPRTQKPATCPPPRPCPPPRTAPAIPARPPRGTRSSWAFEGLYVDCLARTKSGAAHGQPTWYFLLHGRQGGGHGQALPGAQGHVYPAAWSWARARARLDGFLPSSGRAWNVRLNFVVGRSAWRDRPIGVPAGVSPPS